MMRKVSIFRSVHEIPGFPVNVRIYVMTFFKILAGVPTCSEHEKKS